MTQQTDQGAAPGEDQREELETSDQFQDSASEESSEDQAPSEGDAVESEDKLVAEVEKYKDIALRAEAEMQNLRRRAERDVQNAHKYGIERLLQNLLPVLDSLEKAVEVSEAAASDDDDPQLQGIRLCSKLFVDVLTREGVEALDPLGEPFDPNLHEALSMIENPDLEPNSVMTVIQKGYRLNERLVRPAKVMVSKSAS
jgi:molecular chaperone GrpE